MAHYRYLENPRWRPKWKKKYTHVENESDPEKSKYVTVENKTNRKLLYWI